MAENQSPQLIDPTLLIRFSQSLEKTRSKWSDETGIKLTERHDLGTFNDLTGKKQFADLKMGWNANGIYVHLRVHGKTQSIWARTQKPEDSDGLQIWIDTRDTHMIHRATQYCHWFVLLPVGAGKGFTQPSARMLPINRAKQHPNPIIPDAIRVKGAIKRDGYELQAFIPSDALTGFNPDEYQRLGFFYKVTDRELGTQHFSLGNDYPVTEDPSLWGSLTLDK